MKSNLSDSARFLLRTTIKFLKRRGEQGPLRAARQTLYYANTGRLQPPRPFVNRKS